MIFFATYFDKNYISRGLVLYDSLRDNCPEFLLYVLCLDTESFSFFKENANEYAQLIPLTVGQLEEADSQLRSVKENRSLIEYYFTISPCLPLFLLKKYNLPHICTLDADILFLSNPDPLFQHLNTSSVIITPHKFSDELKDKEKYGIFNVSFQIFKNNSTGIACLSKWREQCISWCGDYVDEKTGYFADQKYLDSWPDEFGSEVTVLNDKTSGLAPWNLNRMDITYQDGRFLSGGERVIFYHFHGFKFFTKHIAANGFNSYKVKRTSVIHKLYKAYWNKVNLKSIQLPIFQANSIRTDNEMLPIDKILNQDGVYIKPGHSLLFECNFINLPGKIRGGIKKLYGLFN